MKRFRLTIQIEVFLAFFLTTCYVIADALAKDPESSSFILILFAFNLNIILLISFIIRSNLIKIPDPPLVCFDSYLIYEHKLLYQHIFYFLQNLPDKKLLNSLELGLYINIYKTKKEKHLLKAIVELCKKCGLPEYKYGILEEIEEYINKTNEFIFQCFCKSDFYEKFANSLENNKKYLFL